MDGECSSIVYHQPRFGGLRTYVVASARGEETIANFKSLGDQCSSKEIFSYNKRPTYSKTGEVPSLLRQCLELIAVNIEFLESLEGFPEDIATKLWNLAVAEKKFDVDSQDSASAITTFRNAFPDTFLPELKLNNILLVNNFEVSLITALAAVQKLDLTNCNMDPHHDLLAQLPRFPVLAVLILANTGIGEVGLNRVLLPCIGGRQLTQLRYLDISANRFGPKTISHVGRLDQLERIVMCLADCQQGGLSLPAVQRILSGRFTLRGRPDLEQVVSRGLATNLITRWGQSLARKSSVSIKPELTNFYTKKRVPLFPTDPTYLDAAIGNISNKIISNKIMFQKQRKRSLGEDEQVSQKKLKYNSDDEQELPENILLLYK